MTTTTTTAATRTQKSSMDNFSLSIMPVISQLALPVLQVIIRLLREQSVVSVRPTRTMSPLLIELIYLFFFFSSAHRRSTRFSVMVSEVSQGTPT